MAELEREQESPGNDLENIRRFFHSAERMYKMEGWKRIHEKDESAISAFFAAQRPTERFLHINRAVPTC